MALIYNYGKMFNCVYPPQDTFFFLISKVVVYTLNFYNEISQRFIKYVRKALFVVFSSTIQ